MKALYVRLGKSIADHRKTRKLSQEDLALMSYLDRTYLARIERGKANPSVKVLSRLARSLRIDLHSLFKEL